MESNSVCNHTSNNKNRRPREALLAELARHPRDAKKVSVTGAGRS